MNQNNFFCTGEYESPCCDVMKISSEGILCASFDGIEKEFEFSFDE